ncbi:MAG: AraC family transcriptional regulator [Victivallaceae bacterium]|nr:AraC family transcriptional regulator [Victivallaceae bacterium]
MSRKIFTLEGVPRFYRMLPNVMTIELATDHLYRHNHNVLPTVFVCFTGGRRGPSSQFIINEVLTSTGEGGARFSVLLPGTQMHTIRPQRHDEIAVCYPASATEFWAPYKENTGKFEETARYGQLQDTLRETLRHIEEPGVADHVDLLILQMVAEVLASRKKMQQNGTVDPRIENIASYLRGHFTEEVNFEWLFKQYGMSRRTFYRQWMKSNTVRPLEFLMEHRLQYAAKLLRDKALSIQDVAFECGFQSAPYFGQCFQRRFCVSPSAFRRKPEKRKA